MFTDTDLIPSDDKQKAYSMIHKIISDNIKMCVTITYYKDHIDVKTDTIKKFTINFKDEQTVFNNTLKIVYTNYKELNDAFIQMLKPVTPVKKSRFRNVV